MDARTLARFVQIVEMGSFSRAARKLSIAQPALSQQVQKLEDELGVSLLIRHWRGIQLTEAGTKLLHHSKIILRQLELARADVVEASAEIKGHVVIGIPTSISPILSVALIETAREKLPGVTLNLIENLSGYLREWTQSGRIDISLLFDAAASAGLAISPQLFEQLWIAGHRKSLKKATVRFSSLENYPLVMPAAPHGLRALVETAAFDQKVKLNVVQELESAPIIMELIKCRTDLFTIQGMGALHREKNARTIGVARIIDPPITRPIVLAISTAKPATKAMVEVKALIASLIKDLVKSGEWKGLLVGKTTRPS